MTVTTPPAKLGIAMTPAFSYIGGKARLRKWLVSKFPDSGMAYIEPFAGRGNVYFAARRLNFQRWILADRCTRFLEALRSADLNTLPERVDKTDFPHWRASGCEISVLIEPRITFGGKGYAYGYNGDCGTHVGYRGHNYYRVCVAARALLESAEILQQDWRETLTCVRGESFVYLDPPYWNTQASYPNIDHQQLVEALNSAGFNWALSGYRNPLYDSKLKFRCRFEYERNSEIKSSNSGKREAVIETLWTNYDL